MKNDQECNELNFMFFFSAAKHSDGGMYTCTLMDEYGGELSSKSFRVIVLSK